MRGKLVKILGRLLPERKHPAGKQSKRFAWFAVMKFLEWSSMGLLGLLAVWIVGVNFLAEQQEKKIEQEMAEWAKQFPKTEPNDSALKLRALVAKLGISSVASTSESIDAYTELHPDFQRSYIGYKIYKLYEHVIQDYMITNIRLEQMRRLGKVEKELELELSQYLDNQLAKPTEELDAPPERLLQYLESKAVVIEAIRNHVINNEMPHWGTDINYLLNKNNDISYKINNIDRRIEISQQYLSFFRSNFRNLEYLQKIIALDILEKKRQGQTQAASEMLEVSWKINQSFRDRPDLISQEVALQAGIYPTGVMRKLENIPAEWQQRLSEHDYRKSLLTSLEGELILIVNLSSIYEYTDWEFSYFEKILKFLGPLSKPYIRFAMIDYMKIVRLAITRSYKYQQNICLFKSMKINEELAWWNGLTIFQYLISQNITELFNQERKAAQYMLDLELNQKILQVKALAAKEGQWPKSVPNMESLICPGSKWVYQVSPDGTMSISLSNQPEWLVERVKDNINLPLTYRDRTPPPKKKDSSARN